jgi:hypothetical protein
MYGTAGVPQSALADEFLRGDDGYGFWIECPSLLPGLASVAVPGFGAPHREMMTRFPNLGSFIVLARDGADRGRSNGDVRVDRRGRVRIRYELAEPDARTLRNGLAAAARLHLAAGAAEALTIHEPGIIVRNERDIAAIHSAPMGPKPRKVKRSAERSWARAGAGPAATPKQNSSATIASRTSPRRRLPRSRERLSRVVLFMLHLTAARFRA